MSGDMTIRRLTAAAVLLVAGIAAVISYIHIEHLAVTVGGQTELAATLLPLSIDGTVVASSMVMLRAARAGIPTPWLARSGLALSVAATLAANVGYGASHGLAGALMSGWPAAAFLICAEMALGMVRRTRPVTGAGDSAPAAGNGAPAYVHEAQRVFAGQVAAGEVPTIRAIRSSLGVGSHRAQEVRAHLEVLARR